MADLIFVDLDPVGTVATAGPRCGPGSPYDGVWKMLDGPFYLDDRALLTLTEPISEASALRLRQQLSTSIRYYHYDRIDLLLASPGGEWAATEAILSDFTSLRDRHDVRIATHAAGSVASAAAVLLAMGNLGYRSAHPESRILLHEPRVQLAAHMPQEITLRDVDILGSALHGTTEGMIARLTDHIRAGVSPGAGEQFALPLTDERSPNDSLLVRDRLAALLRTERWLSAQQALEERLIDRICSDGFSSVKVRPISSRGLV